MARTMLNPKDSESMLLDHYAGLAMQSLVDKYSFMIPGSGGASEIQQPTIDPNQLARTAYRIAEEMILTRRDFQHRIERRTRETTEEEMKKNRALMYDVDQ